MRSSMSSESISNVALITALCDAALELDATAVMLMSASETTAATSRKRPARSRAMIVIGARYPCGSIWSQLTSTARSCARARAAQHPAIAPVYKDAFAWLHHADDGVSGKRITAVSQPHKAMPKL